MELSRAKTSIFFRPRLFTCRILHLYLLLTTLGFSYQTQQSNQVINEFTETTFTTYSGWTISSGITNAVTVCGDFNSLFGGYLKFGQTTEVSKSYSIVVPHYSLTVQFNFVKIDSWDPNEGVSVYLMGNFVSSFLASQFNNEAYQCGGSGTGLNPFTWGEEMASFSNTLTHTSSSLDLKLVGNLNGALTDESWGMRDIVITINLCDTTCLTCSGPLKTDCVTCPINSIFSSGTCTCRDYYYFADTIPCASSVCGSCQRCHKSCKTCKGPNDNDCLSCDDPDIHRLGKCVSPSYSEVISWDMYDQASVSSTIPTWTTSPPVSPASMVSVCGGLNLFGGYQIFSTAQEASKIFSSLPPHYKARIRVQIIKIDLFDETVYIDIDGVRKSVNSFAVADDVITGNVCGDTSNEGEKTVSILLDHTSSTLTLTIGSTFINSAIPGKYFGFLRLEVTVYKCFPRCSSCLDLTKCTGCKSTFP